MFEGLSATVFLDLHYNVMLYRQNILLTKRSGVKLLQNLDRSFLSPRPLLVRYVTGSNFWTLKYHAV
jgi:hypothetical protein